MGNYLQSRIHKYSNGNVFEHSTPAETERLGRRLWVDQGAKKNGR